MQHYNRANIRQQRLERNKVNRHIMPVDPSWLFDNEGEDLNIRLHKLLCNDTICRICCGTEEERELQNLENTKLLFGDECDAS